MMIRTVLRTLLLLLFPALALAQTTAHTLPYAPGKTITLSLPQEFDINIAATGMKRVRFFAQAPDGRIFATSMYNLADNTHGAIYLLDGWNAKTHTFARTVKYLDGLRNPNNLAFWTDPATKQTWMYIPLTDKLVRYRYKPGAMAPDGPPEVLTTYPDYGLGYKYGGWHLTRTVAVATLHGATHLYVTTGSSCNYCKEQEAVRASLTEMDMDGTHEHIVAHGLRNAVDLRFVPGIDGGALFATNMGDDHLGDKLPEDTFFELDSNAKPITPAPNYGWPTCYFAHGKPVLDTTPLPGLADPSKIAERPVKDSVYGKQSGVAAAGTNLAAQVHAQTGPDLGPVPAPLTSCDQVPPAYTTFAAHSSPLGLTYFADDNTALKNTFLVALHGAGHTEIGTGYRIVRFTSTDRTPRDFVTGFLTGAGTKALVRGRPCGLLQIAPDEFLLTDDWLGLVYDIRRKP